jgi:hypothetical protein
MLCTMSGTIADAQSGVRVNMAADAVTDEYGQVQPKGKPGHDRLCWLM